MIDLAAAVQFLLISPAFVKRPFTPAELGRSTAFFPLIGLLLGGMLAGADALLAHILPAEVRSALVLALWIILTGALHFDGLLDSADGLFGGGTAEERMRIMRDERTGAYAMAAGLLILLTMYSALNVIEQARGAALLMAPVLGRCGITLSVVRFPYARERGLGRDIKDNAGRRQVAGALLTTLIVIGMAAWQLQSLVPMAALAITFLVWRLASSLVLRRIPGMTGDVYGAINMMIEAGVLLTFAAAQ